MKKNILLSIFIFINMFIFSQTKNIYVGDDVKWFNSAPISNDEIIKKVVVIEYFKTWQVSTENTAVYMNLINDTFKSNNFILFALSSEPPKDVEEYIKKWGLKYPVACGKSSLHDIKVEVPAIFLIKNGQIHSYDPMKKYEFNYIWNVIDNFEYESLQSNPDFDYDSWKVKRRSDYFELYKKIYKIAVKILDTVSPSEIPIDMDIKNFEANILNKIVDEQKRNFILSVYTKEESYKKYLLKKNITDADKNKIIDILKIAAYKPIKINETFYNMCLNGMRRIADPSSKYPLGEPTKYEKKFYNVLKRGAENIYDIIDIDIDKELSDPSKTSTTTIPPKK